MGPGSRPGRRIVYDALARHKSHRFNFQTASFADTASRSRRAFSREFCLETPALRSEGAGNAGRPMRPIAACATIVVERTRVSQVTPESPGIPRAMVYGYTVLSPATGFLATVIGCLRRLDASIGASGPHVFAVRFCAVRYRRIRVHRIPPRVRDDREPPLCGTGRCDSVN
jgi:hypothetical protein